MRFPYLDYQLFFSENTSVPKAHPLLDDASTDATHECLVESFRELFLQHNHLTNPLYLFLNSQHSDIVKIIHFIVTSTDYGRYLCPDVTLNTIAQRYSGNSILSLAEMSGQIIPFNQTFARHAVGEKKPARINIHHDSQYCESYPCYFKAEKDCFGTEYLCVLSLCEASDINLFVAYPTFSQSVITPILTRNKAQLQDIFLKSLDASGGMKWFSEHIFSKEGVIDFVVPNEAEKAKYGTKTKAYDFPNKSPVIVIRKESSSTSAGPTVQKSVENRSDSFYIREKSATYKVDDSLRLKGDQPFCPLSPVPKDFKERKVRYRLDDDLANHIRQGLSQRYVDDPVLQSEIHHALNEWLWEFQKKITKDVQEVIPEDFSDISNRVSGRIHDIIQSVIESSALMEGIDSKLKRKWERMRLGTVDPETGLYLPLPQEVPKEWKWHRPVDWKQMTPDQREKSLREYLLNPEGFGQFIDAGILYQDQLNALDERGLSECRNFYRNYKKITALADIIPIKGVRTEKEAKNFNIINPSDVKAQEYYRRIQNRKYIKERKKRIING